MNGKEANEKSIMGLRVHVLLISLSETETEDVIVKEVTRGHTHTHTHTQTNTLSHTHTFPRHGLFFLPVSFNLSNKRYSRIQRTLNSRFIQNTILFVLRILTAD